MWARTRKAARGVSRALNACMMSTYPFAARSANSPFTTEIVPQSWMPQRLDERRISGLLGDSFVKFSFAQGVCLHISTLQGDHCFKKYIFEPSDGAVAHLRYGKLDRKTFKPLV